MPMSPSQKASTKPKLTLGGGSKLGAKKLAAKPVSKLAARRTVTDDDDEPRRPSKLGGPKKGLAKKASGVKPKAINKKGWGGAEEIDTDGYTRNLKPKDGEQKVLRFRENEPYSNCLIHWIERENGRRSFPCIGEENDCPLCAIGDSPKPEHRFNIVVLTDGEPIAYSYAPPKSIYSKIKTFAEAARTKPLTKRWYLLSREGSTMTNTRYSLEDYRRAEDISEDFPDLYVPDDDEIAALDMYTDEDFEKETASFEEMEKAALEIAGA